MTSSHMFWKLSVNFRTNHDTYLTHLTTSHCELPIDSVLSYTFKDVFILLRSLFLVMPITTAVHFFLEHTRSSPVQRDLKKVSTV